VQPPDLILQCPCSVSHLNIIYQLSSVEVIATLRLLQYFPGIHNAMRIKNMFYPSHHIDGNTSFRIMQCMGFHGANAMLCRNRPLVGG